MDQADFLEQLPDEQEWQDATCFKEEGHWALLFCCEEIDGLHPPHHKEKKW